MIKFALWLGLTALATSVPAPWSSAASDNPLDAPALPDRPTVRTELHRAAVASRGCSAPSVYGLETVAGHTKAIDYLECVYHVIVIAAQHGNYSNAFETGVFFERSVQVSILLKVMNIHPNVDKSDTARDLREFGKQDLHKAIELGKQLHLTLDDICDGVGYVDCKPRVIPDFRNLGWIPSNQSSNK